MEEIITITENGLGQFQAWRGNRVLRPCNLKWYPNYQSHHDFMFFSSEEDAIDGANKALLKCSTVSKKEIIFKL